MRKNHSIDLKIETVLKASRSGVTASKVADEMGVHIFSLYCWKKDLEIDLELEEKLRQLRKANEHLRLENAVLKKLKEYGEAKKEAFKI